jgi:hypothetical protein
VEPVVESDWIKLPLPSMIGTMVFATARHLLNRPTEVPGITRPIGQMGTLYFLRENDHRRRAFVNRYTEGLSARRLAPRLSTLTPTGALCCARCLSSPRAGS